MQSTPTVDKTAANTEMAVVGFNDDFYRDGFRTVLLSLGMIVASIGLLIILSLYFFLHQVLPISFPVYQDWRVQPDVPLDRPYLHSSDLLQWVSTALPDILGVDFLNYNQDIKNAAPYFTPNGWAKYLEVMNTYFGSDEVVKNKEFVMPSALGAPVLLNQGIVDGKYGWWVQMPLNVSYSGIAGNNRSSKLNIQTLVVRVSTLNNLDGVAIENMIVTKS